MAEPLTNATFDGILDALRSEGVHEQPMFGQRGLMADGHLFATTYNDAFAARLLAGTQAFAVALALDGSQIWDPTRGKRSPFHDWIEVTSVHVHLWPSLADAAFSVRARPGSHHAR